jgi:hypothetical protein
MNAVMCLFQNTKCNYYPHWHWFYAVALAMWEAGKKALSQHMSTNNLMKVVKEKFQILAVI